VDWFVYYDLALQWVGNDGDAYKRSAVSRAYYAMFCTARNELLNSVDEYNPPECGSEHVYVWNSYKEDRHPRGTKHIGVLGNRLRRYRNRADYDNVILNFPELVEDAMASAAELKEHLDDLRI
jgi:uncharacterized protein (UPF0332 family)